MREGSLFEDFLYLLKARNEDAVLVKALIFSALNKKALKGENLDDLHKRLSKKNLEELLDTAIHHLSGRREVDYIAANFDGRLYYGMQGKDGCEYDLYVTPNFLVDYELQVSTGWTEKPKQDYAGLKLPDENDAINFFEDLKILRNVGANFEDVGKMLNKKYPSMTWYRTQIRTHYLEGVLSAQPGALPDNPEGKRDVVDYCTCVELTQTRKENGTKSVGAVLTINTKWNFVKR